VRAYTPAYGAFSQLSHFEASTAIAQLATQSHASFKESGAEKTFRRRWNYMKTLRKIDVAATIADIVSRNQFTKLYKYLYSLIS
jgi:hypothetical protein